MDDGMGRDTRGCARSVMRRHWVMMLSIVALTIITAQWYWSVKTGNDALAFQVEEAARVTAAFLEQSGGRWPTSVADLQSSQLVERLSEHEFRVVTREVHGGIGPFGPSSLIIDTRRIAIGWGGTPVDASGNLVGVQGGTPRALRGRVAVLSARLRGLGPASRADE